MLYLYRSIPLIVLPPSSCSFKNGQNIVPWSPRRSLLLEIAVHADLERQEVCHSPDCLGPVETHNPPKRKESNGKSSSKAISTCTVVSKYNLDMYVEDNRCANCMMYILMIGL